MCKVALGRAVHSSTADGGPYIVKANQSHAIDLQKVVEQAYAQEGAGRSAKPAFPAKPVALADIRALIDTPNSQLLVAIENDAVVGCVLVSKLPARRSVLGLLGVDPACRKRGLGARLITQAAALAAKQFGASTIELCVFADHVRLVSYYQRHGFALTGELRTFPDRDMRLEFAVMEKALGRSARRVARPSQNG